MDTEQINRAMHGLSKSFEETAQQLSKLLASNSDNLVDIHDPISEKKRHDALYKQGLSNMKHIKRRGR